MTQTQEFFGPLPESDFNLDKQVQWFRRQTLSAQKIISGSIQVGVEISSENFESGVSGWQIDGDGNAEFNDVTVRGTIVGSVFKTAESGVRLVIDGASGDSFVSLYNSSNSLVGIMGYDPSTEFNAMLLKTGAGSTIIRLETANVIARVSNSFSVQNASGTPRITLDSGGNVDAAARVFSGATGSAGFPAFALGASLNSGLFMNASDQMGLASDGAIQISLGSSSFPGANIRPGFITVPGIRFFGDANTGITNNGSDVMGFACGGVAAFELTTARTYVPHAYNDTTGAAANAVLSGGGGIYTSVGRFSRSTSSLKYKEGWQFADEGVLASLELPTPIVWEDKVGGTMLGFGTEHVHEMLEAATQDDYENYDVRSLVAILSAKVKRLEARL